MSKLEKETISVSGIELPSTENVRYDNKTGDNWWEYNVFEQFPTKKIQIKNGLSYIEVDKPHEGCYIKTVLSDSKMNGESFIYSGDNTLMATLTFVNGIASGPCTLYKNESLFFTGYYVNGYREGRGQEYDESGNMVFDGFYKKGKKLNIIPSNEMGKGYWKEMDENGRIIEICQKDELGNKEGFCYSYESGMIRCVSVWNEGKKVAVKKQFRGDIMIEYKNGKKVYEGGFVDSLELGYPPKEVGGKIGENGWRDITRSKLYAVKTGRLCDIILKNRYLFVIVAIMAILCFCPYFILVYLNGGPYGIGYEQESFIVQSGYGNHLLRFTLSNYPNLKDIEIGDNCFRRVRTFQIDGLSQLKTLKIGDNSFTQKIDGRGNQKSKSFHILNCKSLESIEVGDNSFSGLKGDFILKNLSSIQSVKIGSFSFSAMTSFRIDGLNRLKSLKIGYSSFSLHNDLCEYATLKSFHVLNCELLESIEIGNNSFTCFTGDFMLKNLPSIRSLHFGDNLFKYISSFRIDGMSQLRSLKVEYASFCGYSLLDEDVKSKSFHILNCESLESIEIGKYSFSRFWGQLELKNVSSLKYLKVGVLGESANFLQSSFDLKGIFLLFLKIQ